MDELAPTVPPWVWLLVAAAVLAPGLWALQDRSSRIWGKVWGQMIVMLLIAIVGPLLLEILPNTKAIYDLQKGIALSFLVCGLTLPWMVAGARWVQSQHATTPTNPADQLPPASTKSYSERRKRAGY